MATTAKNFNKIDLKELSRSDVHPVMGRQRQLQDRAKTKGMFSKTGTTLMCEPCQIVHLDEKSLMNHIENSHADLLGSGSKNAKRKAKNRIKFCLERICDPSLQVEMVVISNQKERKKVMKEDENNIYEDAAFLGKPP